MVVSRNLLVQRFIFRFHVNFPGVSPRMREDFPDSFLMKRRGLDKVLVLWWCACAGGVVGTVWRGGYTLKDAKNLGFHSGN